MKNDKRMMEKYADVLDMVSKANPQGKELDGAPHHVDQGFALIMMEQAVVMGTTDNLAGVPDGFDWEQFERDMEHCGTDEEPVSKTVE